MSTKRSLKSQNIYFHECDFEELSAFVCTFSNVQFPPSPENEYPDFYQDTHFTSYSAWHFIILCAFFYVSAGVCCLSDIISAFEHGDLSLFESSAIENWHYWYYLQAFYPRYNQQNINSDSDRFRNPDNLSQNPHHPTEAGELTSGVNSTRDACQTMIFTILIMPPIVFNHAG